MPPLDQNIPLLSALIAFAGILLLALQIRAATKQRKSEALSKVLDVNRELITLGFSHPDLFNVLVDAEDVAANVERHYLQLWFNQFSQVYDFLKESTLEGEHKVNLKRDISNFMEMENAQRYWKKFEEFYPDSFRRFVEEILKKREPHKAAHMKSGG